MEINPSINPPERYLEDTKKRDDKLLFETLNYSPKTRRMAATEIGYPDQTYMVTQIIYNWLESGEAQVVGVIKCKRSGRIVQAITTNPELFINPVCIQWKLF